MGDLRDKAARVRAHRKMIDQLSARQELGSLYQSHVDALDREMRMWRMGDMPDKWEMLQYLYGMQRGFAAAASMAWGDR